MLNKRIISMFLSLLMLIGSYASFAESEEQKLKQRESYTRIIEVPGRKLVYMAQNSPEWADLIFSEKGAKQLKRFGESGCTPTAISLAILNMVPMEKLSLLSTPLKKPVQIDTKSITRDFGQKQGTRFLIETDEDYFRYFPAIVAGWACGNNNYSIKRPGSHSYYKTLLNLYGLKYFTTRDINECIEVIKKGGIVVTSSGGDKTPIAPKFGHYFLLVGADDEYVYIMDNYFRGDEGYPDDKKHLLEIVDHGIARFKIADTKKMGLNLKFVICPNEDSPNYTEEDLERILNVSNSKVGIGNNK
ncbi:MAG: C39 family peptidase [Eubacteriales bacterium]|nr:C39 family peptidase [Eubacteriales bacterium]